jgi:hypothetical protein
MSEPMNQSKTKTDQVHEAEGRCAPAPGSAHPLVRRPRHKWFAAFDPKTDEGWWGPHDTIEAAAMECLCNCGSSRIFVTQGYKLTKDERYMAEWDWEVDSDRAFEIVLPNDRTERPEAI